MWKCVSGKVVNGHFVGQWLSKGHTTHLATSQHHKLGGWLFSLKILENIKPLSKINKAAYTLQGQRSLIHITGNR
jgi:hypothetical protein